MFGALLILYVFSALRADPIAMFGNSVDDTLYFSSAKALASGQGYILPGFPIHLKATKYPELYPLLLAGIWKIDPRFPGNVNLAVGLTLGFGCVALLFAFLLLRSWSGMDDWQALIVVGLCALTGYFLKLSASVSTDVPFMALMLGAVWLAEVSLRRKGEGKYWALGAGLLGSLAVGFRSLGLAVIMGIGISLLAKRDYRRVFWFSLAAAPLTLLFLGPAFMAVLHPTGPGLAVGLGDTGWTQTLCYYSSYACNWRMNVTTPDALRAVIFGNLKGVIQEPGLYLLSPSAISGSLLSLIVVSLVSIAAYIGIARNVRAVGWGSLLCTFLFMLPVILVWPYTPGRFLVPFLPLFFGGLWTEGFYFSKLVFRYLGSSHSAGDRVVAGLLAAGALALATLVTINYANGIPSEVATQARVNRQVLRDERGAYTWIRKNAAPDAKIVAYDDGRAYFYTGHISVVPIQDTTQSFYEGDMRYARHDAAQLSSVAKRVGATYWLTTSQDYAFTGRLTRHIIEQRQARLLADSPVDYQSADGAVRLYDIQCLTAARKAGCADSLRPESLGDVSKARTEQGSPSQP